MYKNILQTPDCNLLYTHEHPGNKKGKPIISLP